MRAYCRAYPLGRLRAFEEWAGHAAEAASGLDPDEVVFLWDDLTVVRSPVSAEAQVLWDTVSPPWEAFCTDSLGFTGQPAPTTSL
ncbi:hypothetical protein [Streptomyces sp. NBC_00102]|uniref:hypothetical protein n=1 Tax=Streptomyces sp. NBC_00102 TaxID=2975652 RepID=UPI00224E61F9|nr:hypothetical protein [Streptomyces sp. NBC_00102]MCX5395498.1 hypothetical protein [Streptomyces sp. NBC_00102]